MDNARYVKEKNQWIWVIISERLGDLLKTLGKKGMNVSKKMVQNVLKNPSRALKVSGNIASAAASRNPRATLSTLKDVIDFYHTGRGSYLGIIVWIML